MQHNHNQGTWNLILWPSSDILYSLEIIWKWRAIHCCNNCCICDADQFPAAHFEQMASWQHLIHRTQSADDILMTEGNVRALSDFTSWLLSFFFLCKSLYTRRDISILSSIFDYYCVLVPCLWAMHWKSLNLLSMQMTVLHFKRVLGSFFSSFKISSYYPCIYQFSLFIHSLILMKMIFFLWWLVVRLKYPPNPSLEFHVILHMIFREHSGCDRQTWHLGFIDIRAMLTSHSRVQSGLLHSCHRTGQNCIRTMSELFM